jgi:Ssp1 endopeptidase immunity protein Rap1a
MRALALFLFACVLTPTVHARDLPRDGNALLEYCSVIVEASDNPSSYLQSLSGDRFTEKMEQFHWCAGYLQGTQDVYELTLVHLATFSMAGLTFDGPEKLRQYAAKSLRGPCFPDNAPILQLARVLVKWLREHPERLHEYKNILTTDAFNDAFPCKEAAPPKEQARPAPPLKP